MRYIRGLTTAAVFITVLILIGMMFSSTVQAKYITSDKILERHTTDLLTLEYFDEACDMYETSYFYENGFKFFNAGNTYLEIKNTTQGLTYDTNGWTGFSDNPYVVGDYSVDTPHDRRAIAMKCAEVNDKGKLLSAGAVLGKSMNTMSKQYPTFVTLPDSNYFYNITVKPSSLLNLNTEDDSNYYIDMYIPSMTICFIAFNLDDIVWATEHECYDNLSTVGLSLTFMRGTNEDTSGIHDSRLNNYMFTYSEWELVGGVETRSFSDTVELDSFSNNAWISMSMSFKEVGNQWYAHYILNSSGFKDPVNDTAPVVIDQHIQIFSNENSLPVLNYFSNYYYHHEKDMEKVNVNWWDYALGVIDIVLGVGVLIGLVLLVVFTGGLALPVFLAFLGSAVVLVGMGVYLMINAVTYNTAIEGIVERTRLIFHEAKELMQSLIDTIMMKPAPTRSLVNYIDELSIEWGNHVPDSYFSMYQQMNTSITDPELISRVNPIVAFDTVDFVDTNSVDYDSNYPLDTRFYTFFSDDPSFRYEYMNSSDSEISCYNSLGGYGSIRVDPQHHSKITIIENTTFENVTYDTLCFYDKVKVETRSITFDNLGGCGVSHEDETRTSYFGGAVISGAVFDTNGTLIDHGEVVDVDWFIILARMNNRNAKVFTGDPVFFDASSTEYIIDMDTGATQQIDQDIIEQYGLKFRWDLGDGTTVFGLNVTHKYTHEGRYNVTLMVTDKDGNTDTDRGVVVVYETQKFKFAGGGWLQDIPGWVYIVALLLIFIGVGVSSVVGVTEYKKKRKGG